MTPVFIILAAVAAVGLAVLVYVLAFTAKRPELYDPYAGQAVPVPSEAAPDNAAAFAKLRTNREYMGPRRPAD